MLRRPAGRMADRRQEHSHNLPCSLQRRKKKQRLSLQEDPLL